jgi:hypothetical protein
MTHKSLVQRLIAISLQGMILLSPLTSTRASTEHNGSQAPDTNQSNTNNNTGIGYQNFKTGPDLEKQIEACACNTRQLHRVANEFAFYAVNNVGCQDFASFFHNYLLPRLEVLRRREFSQKFLKNILWDYSERRYKSFNLKYDVSSKALVRLSETYFNEGYLSEQTLQEISRLGQTHKIACLNIRPKTEASETPVADQSNAQSNADKPNPSEIPIRKATPVLEALSINPHSNLDSASNTSNNFDLTTSPPTLANGGAGDAPLRLNLLTQPPTLAGQSHAAVEARNIERPASAAPAKLKATQNDAFDKIIRDSVDAAYGADESCKKVFTGNAGQYLKVEKKGWALTLARSFANDLCAPRSAELNAYQTQDFGATSDDALGLDHFKSFMDRFQNYGPNGNRAATYMLIYSLGLRESSGQFDEGPDRSARNNLLHTMESGAFQVASGTLDGPVRGLQALFRSYAEQMSAGIHNNQTLIQACGLEDLNQIPGNASQKRHLDHIRHLFGKSRLILPPARSDEFGACSKMLISTSGERKRSNDRENCFIGLQKACPAFAIKYNTMMVRGQRKHFGPLITHDELRKLAEKYPRLNDRKYYKPYFKPACGSLFESILKNKENVCVAYASYSSQHAPLNAEPRQDAQTQASVPKAISVPNNTEASANSGVASQTVREPSSDGSSPTTQTPSASADQAIASASQTSSTSQSPNTEVPTTGAASNATANNAETSSDPGSHPPAASESPAQTATTPSIPTSPEATPQPTDANTTGSHANTTGSGEPKQESKTDSSQSQKDVQAPNKTSWGLILGAAVAAAIITFLIVRKK